MLSRGDRIDRYEIVELIGSGGMGEIYRAYDPMLARQVALKILLADGEIAAGGHARLLKEARAVAALSHVNVLAIHDAGEVTEPEALRGLAYITMELVVGSTLRAYIADRSVPMQRRIGWLRDAARGLSAAHHARLVHRDVKPENVMVRFDGVVKVLDFGIARRSSVDVDRLTSMEGHSLPTLKVHDGIARDAPSRSTGGLVGTLAYMAPEQLRDQAIDGRADQFAWGVMAYELLTGVSPWPAVTDAVTLISNVLSLEPPPPAQVDPKVPAAVSAGIARAMAKDPAARFDSMDALLDAIDDAAARGPARVAGRRARAASALAAIASVVALAGAGFALRARSRPDVATVASAPQKPRAIELLDAPPPAATNVDALAEYRRALADLRDAVRRPGISLRRALALDPELAAADLRLAIDLWQPASSRFYREAVRFRARLDARDQEILHAEEPLQIVSPPDLAEAERRYQALHAQRPLDTEILLQLAAVRRKLDPASAQTTYDELRALDPTMAATEYGAGRAAADAGDLDGALAHYTRCKELSPTAGSCLMAIAKMSGSANQCDAYAEQMARVVVIDPDDFYVRAAAFDATLGAGRSYEEARAALDATMATASGESSDERARDEAHLQGEVALWFGSFARARAEVQRMTELLAVKGVGGALIEQQLAIAEESGVEAEVVSLLKGYVGVRAMTGNDEHDDVVLQAIGRHQALAPAELARVRERWRMQARAAHESAWRLWLAYEAAPAWTKDEAQQVLADRDDSIVPPRNARAGDDAVLGRVLLLADRYADAEPPLRRAALGCRPLVDDWTTDGIKIVRAALDLGRAREGLGDLGGACVAYGRVLDRWGQAAPRSVTADAARKARTRLHCAD